MSCNYLEVAARAALAGAVPRTGPSTIFSPMDAYCWPGKPLATPVPKEDPVGSTPEEARCVAWLMTASAYMSKETAMKVAQQLAYAAKLSRDAILFDGIYESLAQGGLAATNKSGLVRIADVEKALRMQWTDVIVPEGGLLRKVDPYYWGMLESRVRRSVEEHVWALEAALASLPGLAGGQKGQEADDAVDVACRLIVQRLCPVLVQKDAPDGTAATVLDQLATELLPAAAAAAKRVMQEDMRGVRALAALAAAAPEDLDEKIQELDGSLAALVKQPPDQLVGQFADRGLSFEELRAAFPPGSQGCGSLPSVTAPTSLGVRASILACWLQNYAAPVREACVAAMSMLQRASNRALHLSVWSDVEIRPATPGIPQALWPPVAHVIAPGVVAKGGVDRVLAVEHAEGGALRVARLLCTLFHEVRMGLLPSGVVHHSVLTPVVARVRAEREVELGACIARELRPVAAQFGVEWPSGADAPGGGAEAVRASTFVAETVPLPHVPVLPPAAAGMTMETSLVRDHAILNALFKCVVKRRSLAVVAVMLNEVVAMARVTSSLLAGQTEASLVQSARFVCTKIVERANSKISESEATGAVAYQQARKHESGGRVGGIVAEQGGVQVLIDTVQYCLLQMQTNSHQFSREWRPSRSSRSRAGGRIEKRPRPKGIGAA